MTSPTTTGSASPKTGKIVLQIVAGGLAGFGAMSGIMRLLDGAFSGPLGIDLIIAAGVAAIYGLMAIFVGAGVLLPKVGAKVLNVADEQELHDGRRQLLGGAVGMALVSLLVASLALADGPNALLDRSIAALLVVVSLVGIAAISLLTRNQGDELMRRVSLESAALAFWLAMLTFGGWAALSVLGHAAMFSAIALIAGLFALFLFAMFVIIARRGMMTS